ncbi:hypothetical protein EDD86DRAFT_244775 [Gorgonomyces haynaldii]|nr:hypothetical protein EDD86DRAFT_244775 [Gorgonomyces haynaldii]
MCFFIDAELLKKFTILTTFLNERRVTRIQIAATCGSIFVRCYFLGSIEPRWLTIYCTVRYALFTCVIQILEAMQIVLIIYLIRKHLLDRMSLAVSSIGTESKPIQ